MFEKFGFYFDKDNDTGGGGKKPEDDAEDKDKEAKEEEKQGDPSSQKSEDEKDEKNHGGKDEKKFSQADVDQIIKDRLARQKKQDEKEVEKAREKAEEDALKKNSDFQKLAEKHEKTIAELEGQIKDFTDIKEQSKKYQNVLNKYLTEAKKNLPKHVLPLMEKLDIVDALEYVTDHADELGVQVLGVPQTPKEKEKKLSDDEKKQASTSVGNLIQTNY